MTTDFIHEVRLSSSRFEGADENGIILEILHCLLTYYISPRRRGIYTAPWPGSKNLGVPSKDLFPNTFISWPFLHTQGGRWRLLY